MDLSTFASDIPRRRLLAERIDVVDAYLYQLANGYSRPSVALAQRIEQATAEMGPEMVPRWSLRPDVWESPQDEAA
ncbi:MAG: helix-turn-helix domain-containing protein [Nitrosospira sp.]|nr:helix-turn-helix domain-containing protein [Nitrosospira sp.]